MRRQTTPRTWIGTGAQVVRHVRVCGEGHLATATRIELERQGIHRDSDYLLPSLRPALIIACADSEADQSINDAAQQALDEGSPLLLCCLAGPVVRLGPLIEPCVFAAWPQPTPPGSPHAPWPSPNSSPHQRPSAPGAAQSASPHPPPPPPVPEPPESASPHQSPPMPEPLEAASPHQRPPVAESPESASPHQPPPVAESPGPASSHQPSPVPETRASASPQPATSTPNSAAALSQPFHGPSRSRGGTPREPDAPLNPHARLAALLVSNQALNFLLDARNQCVLDRVVELNPWSMESKGYRVFHN